MIYILYSPVFYINGKPHVGHRFTLMLIKCYGRLLYTKNIQVIKYTGTDEHGDKIAACIKEQTYQQYITQMRSEFNKIFTDFNVYNTDSEYHIAYVKFVYNKLKHMGIIYEGSYKGYYCTREERFLNKNEYDINDLAPTITYREENGFFIKIDKNISRNFIQNLDKLVPDTHYHKEIINILQNTSDIFITRKRRHEAMIPIEDTKDLSFYVWFDAINYYNLINSLFVYRQMTMMIFIGCDIIRFHLVLLLHLAYYMYQGFIPYSFVIHGMLKQNEIKISKTDQNYELIHQLEDKYGNLFYGSLIANGITGTIEITEQKIETYIANIKNNVRNFYNRLLGISKLFSKYHNVKTMSLLFVENSSNTELHKIINELASIKSHNIANIYTCLNKLSKNANSLINEYKLWEEHDKKVVFYLQCKLYMKYMLICEFILGHDVEHIFKKINVETWSSLLNIHSDDMSLEQLIDEDLLIK